jgi:hypothetical protein
MDLLALVDRLEELVGNAQRMPIGSRAIVDRRRLLDIVDQMRIAIPQEVREAQQMMADRDARRREAEEEARLVIARAEDRASRMVEQHELTLAARKRAEEVAAEAERRLEQRIEQANRDIEARIAESRRLAAQQMDAADEYAQELLMRLDRQLQAFVRSVQSGISQLDTGRTAPAAPSEDTEEESEPAREPVAARRIGGPVLLRREEPPREEAQPEETRVEEAARAEITAEAAALPPQTPPDAERPSAVNEPPPQTGPRPAPWESQPAEIERTATESRAPQRTREEDGLENLLRRRPAPSAVSRQDASVIDDFELPELDDEPTRIRDDDRR